jgi:pyruvate kinase
MPANSVFIAARQGKQATFAAWSPTAMDIRPFRFRRKQIPETSYPRSCAGFVEEIENAELSIPEAGSERRQQRVSLPHPEIFQALLPGVEILLDDGKVRLQVEDADGERARTRVVVGGSLSDRKGVSVVGAVLPLSPLTAKDRVDLDYALHLGADWIALSFVQQPQDVAELRGIVGDRAGIMSNSGKAICRPASRCNRRAI